MRMTSIQIINKQTHQSIIFFIIISTHEIIIIITTIIMIIYELGRKKLIDFFLVRFVKKKIFLVCQFYLQQKKESFFCFCLKLLIIDIVCVCVINYWKQTNKQKKIEVKRRKSTGVFFIH